MYKTAIAAVALLATASAFADDIECTGEIGATTVDGNVIVPSNQSCTLTGTYVLGNVELEDGATLLTRANTIVVGNIQTDGAERVRVRNSSINGNIQLTGMDSTLRSVVVSSAVGGTVEWEGNSAPFLVRLSSVDSDIKVNQNSALARIFDNTVGGNLQCQENEPAPNGARNIVDGNKEDQCASF